MHHQQREEFSKNVGPFSGSDTTPFSSALPRDANLPFEVQLMRALGTDSVEEAMQIAETAGIKPEDIPALLMSHGLS